MKTTVINTTKLRRSGLAVTIQDDKTGMVHISCAGMIAGKIHYEELYGLAQDVRSHMIERNKVL